ncbi:MAG TPA: hypothetical protein VMW50_03305 [Dehalococcoidia bacterium]|nr:hypothetical protein [Dehalococcoidia bacterium]
MEKISRFKEDLLKEKLWIELGKPHLPCDDYHNCLNCIRKPKCPIEIEWKKRQSINTHERRTTE